MAQVNSNSAILDTPRLDYRAINRVPVIEIFTENDRKQYEDNKKRTAKLREIACQADFYDPNVDEPY
jgi:hypothetical protein